MVFQVSDDGPFREFRCITSLAHLQKMLDPFADGWTVQFSVGRVKEYVDSCTQPTHTSLCTFKTRSSHLQASHLTICNPIDAYTTSGLTAQTSERSWWGEHEVALPDMWATFARHR